MTDGHALHQGDNQPKYRDLAIGRVPVGAHRRAVTTSVLLETPFLALRLLRTEGGDGLPVLLLVPPLSGHFAILLRDMVLGLLGEFRVAVLDWANVRHVSPAHGTFGFDDNIEAVGEAIRRLGQPLCVVALCQGGVPALAAIADLANSAPQAVPSSLVLVAAPIDPGANPTPVIRLIGRYSARWYQSVPIEIVGHEFPGHGRRVYAARTQLASLRHYLLRHGERTGDELARKMVADDGADPVGFPFADLYTSVMDIDARHFAENIDRVFLRRDLAQGRLFARDRRIDPGAIRNMSLMTVEGALDDIAAPGQTSAAHALCKGIETEARRALVVPDCGHFGLFHGVPWRDRVLPALREHCLAHATNAA